jgi:hypothetical protein
MAPSDGERDRPKSRATGADIVAGMPDFPSEFPQAHEAAEWMDFLSDKKGKLHLQAVSNGQLPLRVQHLRNWSAAHCTVPQTAVDAADAVKLYELECSAAGRARENERNDEATRIAILEDKSDLFTLITEPMVTTAPLLRDGLRASCRLGNTDYTSAA